MIDLRIPVGEWTTSAVDWVVTNWSAFFEFLRNLFVAMYEAVDWVFTTPPALVVIIVVTLLALLARGWWFGLGTFVGLGLILGVDQWDNAMNTLSLVLVAAAIAILIAVPLGVLAAKSKPVSAVVKPVMDFLQTMPAFVYLIPALLLFRLGVAPGIVATIIFAIAPGVRLTELGIRGVDKETVEAGASFGATPWRILRQIQLPLALPSIMAGINQVIMLSLSMVVIAGLVGAGGLGADVVAALNRLDISLGAEAGLAVVILAMLLDRFTGAFGLGKGLYAKLRSKNIAAGQGLSTKTKTIAGAIALVVVGAIVFVQCFGGNEKPGEKHLTIGVFNGWDEGIATSHLWKAVLEEQGYDITLQNVDAAPLYTGIATGDIDFTTDIWLPITHEAYIEQYGDKMEDLGYWFDQAKLTLAVNKDAPINSIAELKEKADLFNNTIVGIEPAAGLTKATEEQVIPGYGLEDMKFQTSSTVAMLTELKAATDKGENVLVTLWEPHWAYSAFPIKNLEDPEGTLGEAENIHSYGRLGFTEDFPEVSTWIKNFEMSPELLYSLEDALFNQNSDAKQYERITKEWIEQNREFADGLTQ